MVTRQRCNISNSTNRGIAVTSLGLETVAICARTNRLVAACALTAGRGASPAAGCARWAGTALWRASLICKDCLATSRYRWITCGILPAQRCPLPIRGRSITTDANDRRRSATTHYEYCSPVGATIWRYSETAGRSSRAGQCRRGRRPGRSDACLVSSAFFRRRCHVVPWWCAA